MWNRIWNGKKTVAGAVLLLIANIGPTILPQYNEVWKPLGELGAVMMGAGWADKIRKAA